VATAESLEFLEPLTGGLIAGQRFKEQRAYLSDLRGAGLFRIKIPCLLGRKE
jgi:hypothetical protein